MTGKGYETLEIQEGEMAGREFVRVTFGDVNEEERARVGFSALNVSDVTAEHVTIHFYPFCDGTSIIRAGTWFSQAASVPHQPNFLNFTNPLPHFVTIADHSLAGSYNFIADNLSISTNYSEKMLFCNVDVHSDRSQLQRFTVLLLVQSALAERK